jgi:hypothetical protein
MHPIQTANFLTCDEVLLYVNLLDVSKFTRILPGSLERPFFR